MFANFPAIERVLGKKIMSKNYLLLVLRMLTFSIIIIAISGPVIWYEGTSSNFSFILAIDASGSMAATDYEPNRLEAAKNSAKIFVDNAPIDARIGILSFAGIPFLKQLPTEDTEVIKSAIDDIRIEHVGGTAIGSAIIDAATILSAEKKARRIILITDGQNNVGPDIADAIEYANDKHVIVDTIGIATKEGGRVPGLTYVSSLDEDALTNISAKTGGVYYRVENETELAELYKRLAITSKHKLSENVTVHTLFIAFIFLFLEWGLLNTKFRTIP